MSSQKAALKAAKSALDAHDYAEALSQANNVLSNDSQNYHGNVFSGLALEKLDQNEDSVNAYETAIKSKANEPLAWQGIINVCEKDGAKRVALYKSAVLQLGRIYESLNDLERGQVMVDKYVNFVKDHGTRSDYMNALDVLLPSSPLYDFLSGRFPAASNTYIKIAEIVEANESERINKEIGERRTRLGAKVEQVKIEVKRDVLTTSALEDIYRHILNTAHEDEVRRVYEQKLLRHAYDTLVVLPSERKGEKAQEVQELVRGMIILKHPFKFAWDLAVQWNDVQNLEDFDVGLVSAYIQLFADSGTAKVLKGFLSSEISPFPPSAFENADSSKEKSGTEEQVQSEGSQILSSEERLLTMADGIDESPESILGNRLMGEFYLFLEEYESAVEIFRKAKTLLLKETYSTGIVFQGSLDAIDTSLGRSLLQYQAPKNHPEAAQLFHSLLKRNQTIPDAFYGIGMIHFDREEYDTAIEAFTQALAKQPDNSEIRSELAWCKAQQGNWETALSDLEGCNDFEVSTSRDRNIKAQILYRTGICLWELDTSISARKSRAGAYSRFLASLQANISFAPAYTSLGIYYADFAKDKKRARKCFQKAFELSASEIYAAERLARSFANQGDWEMVEIVAERIVATGKLRPPPGSRKKGISWPLAARGVVNLNKQDFTKSIASFQGALRISPEDYHSWVGLGESYYHSGRYFAAIKAFEQAEHLEKQFVHEHVDDIWLTKYMLGNVKRELGEYDTAIDIYTQVLHTRENEFGVSVALLRTLVDSAWDCVETGFFGEASQKARHAIECMSTVVKYHPKSFNVWKALGDACAVFSSVQSHLAAIPASLFREILITGTESSEESTLSELDGVTCADLLDHLGDETPTLKGILNASILAHRRAVIVSAGDTHSQAVAWYNLGWAENRAYFHLLKDTRSKGRLKSSPYLKAGMKCFKRAIELEAGNADFWNALGLTTIKLNPKIAQHSFVRSLHLNDRNAAAWTNYGALCLSQNDHQLANDAFNRAQSVDPDYVHAWYGQGLLALLLGEAQEAQSLFQHAFEISDSSSPSILLQYAVSAFDEMLATELPENINRLVQPLFALGQVGAEIPSNMAAQHLTALNLERAGDNSAAVSKLTAVCDFAEQEYEQSESTLSLAHFCTAKADLARCLLALEYYEHAEEHAEMVLNLASNEAEDDSPYFSRDIQNRCRLSAHLTIGLAKHFLGQKAEALEMLRTAVEESQASADVVSLLSQVAWSKESDEGRSLAKDRLLDCVEHNSSHVASIIILGAIAALDGDIELLESVKSDLKGLRMSDDLTREQRHSIERALIILSGTSSSESSAETTEAKSAIVLAPYEPAGWRSLGKATADKHSCEMAVKTALRSVPPDGPVEIEELAAALSGTGNVGDLQRSLILDPSSVNTWQILSEAVMG